MPVGWFLLELISMEKFTFLASDHIVLLMKAEFICKWTWMNLTEIPGGGSVSGQLGGVMWNASPWFHVCILLENCIGNWLCKYLDSQITWFKLIFTDSPAAAIVILYNGRVNLSITTRKASVLKSANDIWAVTKTPNTYPEADHLYLSINLCSV